MPNLLDPPVVRAFLELQFGVTCALTGLVWLVQLAHYPIFKHLSARDFSLAMTLHRRALAWVAAPLMLAELFLAALSLGTTFWKIQAFRTAIPALAETSVQVNFAGFLLVVLLWDWTLFRIGPIHEALEDENDSPPPHAKTNANANLDEPLPNRTRLIGDLVRQNAWRTGFWTIRALLLFSLLRM